MRKKKKMKRLEGFFNPFISLFSAAQWEERKKRHLKGKRLHTFEPDVTLYTFCNSLLNARQTEKKKKKGKKERREEVNVLIIKWP